MEKYLYNGDDVELVLSGNNSVIARYLQGGAEDQTLCEESGGSLKWLLADHQGSIRDIASSTAVLSHYVYDTFGKITSTAKPTRYGYTGREWDESAGLYYYRARWYDPNTGRFLSQDPKGFAAGDGNLYRYVGNNAVNLTDPSGMMAKGLSSQDYNLSLAPSWSSGSGLSSVSAPGSLGGNYSLSLAPSWAGSSASHPEAVQWSGITAYGVLGGIGAAFKSTPWTSVLSSAAGAGARWLGQQDWDAAADRVDRALELQAQIDASRPDRQWSVPFRDYGFCASCHGSPNGGRVNLAWGLDRSEVSAVQWQEVAIAVGTTTERIQQQTGAAWQASSRSVQEFGYHLVAGLGEVVTPVPTQPIPGPTSYSGLTGRVVGRVVGGVFSALEVIGGGGLAGGSGVLEVGSVGVASPVAVPAFAGGVVIAAHGLNGLRNTFKPIEFHQEVKQGESGAYGALKGETGDELTPHHMPQKKMGYTSVSQGGSLVLPEKRHYLTRTYGWKGARTYELEKDLPFREVLKRDVKDIRNLFGKEYNQGLRKLIKYYREHFPELIQKPLKKG